METQTKKMRFFLNIVVCTLIIRTAKPFAKMRPKTPYFSPLKYEKMKRKTQIMYKFIFNKKLGMLFKNRKRISTWHFLALQINT